MCMDIKGTPKVLKAKKAVKVYKAFSYVTRGGFAVTPYYCARYRRGVVKRAKRFSCGRWGDSGTWTTTPPVSICRVDRGIHSCKTQKRAKCHGDIVVECVIPRGTLYMVGKYNEVVSLAIKPVKAVRGPKDAVQRFNARRPANSSRRR